MSRFRGRLSYANVMSTAAVFVVVAGGSFAVANVKKNQVKSKHVKNDALKSKDLKDEKAVKSHTPRAFLWVSRTTKPCQ